MTAGGAEVKPREFWILKGKHLGSSWRIFTKLNEAENKIAREKNNKGRDYELFSVIEKSAYMKAVEALKRCGTMAVNLTNGKTEYEGDGYGYVLKVVRDALKDLGEIE